ncbi:NRAMP (natural resistance-associated macrophage protein) metal ion transporters [Lentibacillus halodurans]|uniref:NRAMP (Natural resistance-associated macrophage protein) metal ion transporters n=1 Tax=Lentibacillus halodurans TaxID=237679 RepID=A0A1I0XMF4_9BACI|nr:Nramp family divalent metal transporter [Lentibacillus halodurans]SFB02309.1 NRAMP (natural resistance-associated macrophage protein) metal ion transporters [Lentibacillus halodurans]
MRQKGFFERLRTLGPGTLVAASIIGPGTVTTASATGAEFGYVLIWALAFSIIATMFLQEMVTRLGIVSRKELGTVMQGQFSHPVLKVVTVILIITAILIGNAAYETGNITGGAIGLATITGVPVSAWSLLIGIAAGLLLWTGNYKFIEKVFIVLILTMSFCFVITAIVVRPDIGSMFAGIFIPSVPDGAGLLVISLIGTTIVPYTLFLQTSTVQERWKGKDAIKDGRFDVIASMVICGVISIAIVLTAAAAFPIGTALDNPAQMAVQLEPLLGSWAKYIFSIGIFAAGITSSMTAALAAAYATSGALGWERHLKSTRFRLVWLSIILVGVIFASLGYEPIQVILFAQYANGLILPVIVLLLMVVMNNKKLLGEYVNRTWINVAGWLIFVITVILALQSFGILDWLFN